MPVLLLLALFSLTAASPPRPAPVAAAEATPFITPQKCPEATIHYTDQTRGARPRRLDELPPGRLELTVLREVDGCPIPAVLREGIGPEPRAPHSGR